MSRTRRELVDDYRRNPPPTGVFQVRHLATGRVFIMSAMNLPGIMNSLRFQLRSGSHPNKRLQDDWNAAGGDGFAFEVLDKLAPPDSPAQNARADLAALEELWLDKLQPYGERGYNWPKPRRT